MTWFLTEFARLSPLLVWAAAASALTMAAAVIVQRAAIGVSRAVNQRLRKKYGPLVQRAIAGDDMARAALIASPARHRLVLARLMLEPLIDDRDPERIARTRDIAKAVSGFRVAERYSRSWFWWRRALAVRAFGLAQATDHTPQLIAALDDGNEDVRAAALDGLADMHDPAALQAVVVRVNDISLQRGRLGAALNAYGSDCEPLLLEMSGVDEANRLNYIRALAICGTARSRPALRQWAGDARLQVREAVFKAMAHVGLDDATARVAIDGLQSPEPRVRAMAALALRGWRGPGDAPARLAQHLDDVWTVAFNSARTLRSMGPAGIAALQAHAANPHTSGQLARQMLTEADDQR